VVFVSNPFGPCSFGHAPPLNVANKVIIRVLK
jgi:hypothetical protein